MLKLFNLRVNRVVKSVSKLKTLLGFLETRLTKHVDVMNQNVLTTPFHFFGLSKFNVNYELFFNKHFPMTLCF